MSNQDCFRILEDIARDLSGEVVSFPTFLDITFQVIISDASGERLRIDARLRGNDKDNVLFTVTGDRDLLEVLVAHLPASCGSFLISTDGLNPLIVTSGA